MKTKNRKTRKARFRETRERERPRKAAGSGKGRPSRKSLFFAPRSPRPCALYTRTKSLASFSGVVSIRTIFRGRSSEPKPSACSAAASTVPKPDRRTPRDSRCGSSSEPATTRCVDPVDPHAIFFYKRLKKSVAALDPSTVFYRYRHVRSGRCGGYPPPTRNRIRLARVRKTGIVSSLRFASDFRERSTACGLQAHLVTRDDFRNLRFRKDTAKRSGSAGQEVETSTSRYRCVPQRYRGVQ